MFVGRGNEDAVEKKRAAAIGTCPSVRSVAFFADRTEVFGMDRDGEQAIIAQKRFHLPAPDAADGEEKIENQIFCFGEKLHIFYFATIESLATESVTAFASFLLRIVSATMFSMKSWMFFRTSRAP